MNSINVCFKKMVAHLIQSQMGNRFFETDVKYEKCYYAALQIAQGGGTF